MTRMTIIMASAVALLALLTWGAFAVLDRADQRGYDRATSLMAAKVVIQNAKTAALEQRQRTQSAAAAATWETQRDQLQTQINGLLVRPHAPVRVCKSAAPGSSQLPAVPDATASIDDTARGSIDALRTGDDLYGPLVLYAGKCERYRLELKGLQGWLGSVQ